MGSGNTRENNASTVIQLKFGAFTFLFMGDAEGKERRRCRRTRRFVERLLLDRAKSEPDLLRADVLKVGHHGSETGSTLEFIRAVRPDIIVVMSGRKPFNGTFLPDPAVLERYRRENSRLVVVRTDEGDAREASRHDQRSGRRRRLHVYGWRYAAGVQSCRTERAEAVASGHDAAEIAAM